jgi:hypothetical protein
MRTLVETVQLPINKGCLMIFDIRKRDKSIRCPFDVTVQKTPTPPTRPNGKLAAVNLNRAPETE